MTTLDKLEWLGHLTARMSNRHAHEASLELGHLAVREAGALVLATSDLAQVRKRQVDPTGNSTSSLFLGLNSPDPAGFLGPVFLDTEMVLQLSKDAAREIRQLRARVAQLEGQVPGKAG